MPPSIAFTFSFVSRISRALNSISSLLPPPPPHQPGAFSHWHIFFLLPPHLSPIALPDGPMGQWMFGLLLLLLLQCRPLIGPSLPEYPFISCFSCASEDYESIFLRAKSPALFGRPILFDRLCDSRLELVSMTSSALVPCDSACISVLEPQFFGGVQNEHRPFTFVRGCASDIFELAIAMAGPEGVPAEIEFLHRAQACLELPVNQIWPQLGDAGSNKEIVRVCSCATDECNIHDDLKTAALTNGGGRARNGWWWWSRNIWHWHTGPFSTAFAPLILIATIFLCQI